VYVSLGRISHVMIIHGSNGIEVVALEVTEKIGGLQNNDLW
jgi:hypothetical protein